MEQLLVKDFNQLNIQTQKSNKLSFLQGREAFALLSVV